MRGWQAAARLRVRTGDVFMVYTIQFSSLFLKYLQSERLLLSPFSLKSRQWPSVVSTSAAPVYNIYRPLPREVTEKCCAFRVGADHRGNLWRRCRRGLLRDVRLLALASHRGTDGRLTGGGG